MDDLTFLFEPMDHLPVSVFCCDASGRILYKNRFARAQFPAVRRGARLCRFCDPAIADTHAYLQVCGQSCAVLCCPEAQNGTPVFWYYLLPVLSEIASQRTAGLLSQTFSRTKTRSPALPEYRAVCRRHALKLIREQDRYRVFSEMLFATLSGICDVRPGEAYAFSGVDFLKTFSGLLMQFRARTGIKIEVFCQVGVTLFANYYDLHLALLYVLQYAIGTLCADEIILRLTGSGTGAKLSCKANDLYGASGLYGTELKRLNAQTPLLYPLACAEFLCRKYRGSVRLIPCEATKKPAEFAVLQLPATYALPLLNVRDTYDSYDPDFEVFLPNGKRFAKQIVRKVDLFDHKPKKK